MRIGWLVAVALTTGAMLASGAGAHEAEHAIGAPGKAAAVGRTVAVTMTDQMRFTPATVTVRRGETIRFLLKNTGETKHEMVLGSATELRAHAEMMQRMPHMEHADANAVSVEPGQTGELIWTFAEAGRVDFACLVPGHLEAGMTGHIEVQR